MNLTRQLLVFISGLALLGACRAGADEVIKAVKKSDNYVILGGAIADKTNNLKGKLVIEIQTTAKWKFNEKAPVAVDIEPPANLKLTKKKLRKKDVAKLEKTKCRFEVPFEAPAKGTHQLKIKFDFVICTDTLCQKKRFTLAYPLIAG
jgi:hypothetical protein